MTTDATTSKDFLVSEIKSPGKNQNLHGIVTTISPIKKSQRGSRYAKGRISDGKLTLPFTCYNYDEYSKLKNSSDTQMAVKLCNIDTKSAIIGDGIDITVRSCSTVQPSNKEIALQHDKIVQLVSITEKGTLQTGTVECTVTKVNQLATIEKADNKSGNLQRVVVEDTSGEHVISLWDNSCNVLREGKTYRISEITKNEYGYKLSPYSQIDEIQQDYSGYDITGAIVYVEMCCQFCTQVIVPVDDSNITCASCHKRFKVKSLLKDIRADINFKRNGQNKMAKFDKGELAHMLKCTENKLEQSSKTEIADQLLDLNNN